MRDIHLHGQTRSPGALISQILSPYEGGAFSTSPGPKSSVYVEKLQMRDFWVADPLEINISGSTSKCSETSAVIDIRIFPLRG